MAKIINGDVNTYVQQLIAEIFGSQWSQGSVLETTSESRADKNKSVSNIDDPQNQPNSFKDSNAKGVKHDKTDL